MTQPEYAYDAADFQPAEAVASDCLFVCCYTDGDFAYPVSTIEQILAAGKGVMANHENATLELSGGWSAGISAATRAVAAVQAWGMPGAGLLAIAFSCDSAVSASQFPAYADAFRAIRQVLAGRYLVGYYGELALYKYLRGLGLVDVKCWLSASTGFPGYDPNDPDVGLVQQLGSDIPDTDRNLVRDGLALGVWYPAGFTGTGTQESTTPTTGAEDDDMKNFHVKDNQPDGDGGTYIVSNDLSGKTRLVTSTDEANSQEMIADGTWEERAFTHAQIMAIPDRTVYPKQS